MKEKFLRWLYHKVFTFSAGIDYSIRIGDVVVLKRYPGQDREMIVEDLNWGLCVFAVRTPSGSILCYPAWAFTKKPA
jgi:hypothetical protein